MKIPLKGVRRVVESLFVDNCAIRADIEGKKNEAWNEDTGRYFRPPEDPATIYSGPCMVSRIQASPTEEGASPGLLTSYWVSIPFEPEPNIPLLSHLEITAVGPESDLLLVGQVFRIVEVVVSTYQANRRLRCEQVEERVVR